MITKKCAILNWMALSFYNKKSNFDILFKKPKTKHHEILFNFLINSRNYGSLLCGMSKGNKNR
jgi:hypothetical protein